MGIILFNGSIDLSLSLLSDLVDEFKVFFLTKIIIRFQPFSIFVMLRAMINKINVFKANNKILGALLGAFGC